MIRSASRAAEQDIIDLAGKQAVQRPLVSQSQRKATAPPLLHDDRAVDHDNADNFDKSMDSLALFKLRQSGRLGPEAPVAAEDVAEVPAPDLDKTLTPDDIAVRTAIVGIGAELPEGQCLKLVIRSTWGDPHYVGLTGVQCYDMDGYPLHRHARLQAQPSGVQIMKGLEGDPRVVDNLVDDVNQTNDVLHMWLAPFFGEEQEHSVTLTFASMQRVAAVRIWNYNESRMYSYRGARQVELWLDTALIFTGEVRQAPGHMHGDDENSFGELLLFTRDEAILAHVYQHETVFADLSEQCAADNELRQSTRVAKRPNTNDGVADNQAACRQALADSDDDDDGHDDDQQAQAHAIEAQQDMSDEVSPEGYGSRLRLRLLESWGDPHYIGLTGLALVDEGKLASFQK